MFRESSLELSVLLNLCIKLVCEVSCLVWLEQGSLKLVCLSKEVSDLVWLEQGSLFVLCDLEQGSLLLVCLSISCVIFVIIVKSLGSAWGLDYSRFVRGTSIKFLCVLLLSLSLSYLCFVFLSSFLHPLHFNLFSSNRINFSKHNSTPLLVFFTFTLLKVTQD